jgi:tetratricopeptide (TPR) repeat protein
MPDSTPDHPSDALAILKRQPRAVAAWQSAQQHLVQGRHVAALNAYRALVAQFPDVAGLWAELGMAASHTLDFAQSRAAFAKAGALARTDADLLVTIGQQYHRLRRLDEATHCFEMAVAADPSSVHAPLSLAAWLERNGQLAAARAAVEECLKGHREDERVRYFHAFLLQRDGHNDQAETELRDLLKSNPSDADVKISASHLLATVLDATGQYAEALGVMLETKALVRQRADTAALEKAYEKTDAGRRELLAALTCDAIRRWREEADTSDASNPPALLAGPPRSGTTLMEQVLGAHPDILVFDEPESFATEVLNIVAPAPPARPLTLKTLNTLTAPARAGLIRRYHRSLRRETEEPPAGKVLLDKNPSLTASLPVWLRFFPRSKVIVTLRDPRDIVISCFFQNLTLTHQNVNFLSLARTAKYYADSMDVWLRLRDLGGFEWVETRYEEMVNNLEAEGRRVMEFLGLPWHEAQARYYDTARRKFVFAPTYSDVTKPVYRRAVRRWEHYTEALQPVQPMLAPYCRAFGYLD